MTKITKKIATITLHASYNFGSALQAYALQEFIKKLDKSVNYEIINLRTTFQKKLYTNIFNKDNLNLRKKMFRFILRKYEDASNLREKRFEDFISKELNTTQEFSSFEEIKNNAKSYDYYISGGDQVWNYNALLTDFDWSFLLGFTNSKNKISYSASLGPLNQNEDKQLHDKFFSEINKFKEISVREDAGKAYIEENSNKKAEIHVDPTMLLTQNEWKPLIKPQKPIINGKYIFLYQFWCPEAIKVANKMSKILKLPVVIPKFPLKQEWWNGFKLVLDAGPKEFLNLISNAEYVVGSSYHACVFSIIFNKRFFAVNTRNDYRLQTLLKTFNLENRAITPAKINKNFKIDKEIDYSSVNKLVQNNRNEAKLYLEKALEIRKD